MLTTDILRDEHTGVLAVLEQLERAVAGAECGVAIPTSVFADIREFFAVFVDRCHHSKEEQVLFPALGTSGADLQRRLEREHAQGRRLAGAYATAVRQYVPGDGTTARDLASAARAYAQFLRSHIALETDQLFPLVENGLTDTQDALAVKEFDRIEAEEIGEGTHERLHGMIAGLGPRIDAAIATVDA